MPKVHVLAPLLVSMILWGVVPRARADEPPADVESGADLSSRMDLSAVIGEAQPAQPSDRAPDPGVFATSTLDDSDRPLKFSESNDSNDSYDSRETELPTSQSSAVYDRLGLRDGAMVSGSASGRSLSSEGDATDAPTSEFAPLAPSDE